MADEILTFADIKNLLADNTTGDAALQDIRNAFLSGIVHTEIGRPALSTNFGTSYVKVPMTLTGVFERGFVADIASDSIIATPVDLKAMVYVEIQIDDLEVGRTVTFSVFVSNVEQTRFTRTFKAAGHYSWSLGVQLVEDDTIDLRVLASAPNTSIDLDLAVLRAIRIGIE